MLATPRAQKRKNWCNKYIIPIKTFTCRSAIVGKRAFYFNNKKAYAKKNSKISNFGSLRDKMTKLVSKDREFSYFLNYMTNLSHHVRRP